MTVDSNYRGWVFRWKFALLAALVATFYAMGSIFHIYVLILASLFVYSLSLFMIIKRRFSLTSYFAMISLPLTITTTYHLNGLSARFTTHSSEANFFDILARGILSTGHYPQDSIATIYKPEYYWYPASSVLLAVLAQILSVDPTILIAYPVTHYVITPVVFALIYKIVLGVEHSKQSLLMLTFIPIIAIFFSNMLYFVYNNIARFLLLILTLVLIAKMGLKEYLVYTLLTIGASLYHSQEPTFFAICALLAFGTSLLFKYSNDVQLREILRKFFTLVIVWAFINIYISFMFMKKIFDILELIMMNLIKGELRYAEARTELAITVLTLPEIVIVGVGFILFLVVEAAMLLFAYRYKALNQAGSVLFFVVFIIGALQFMSLISVHDVYLSLRWLFALSLMLTLVWIKGMHIRKQPENRLLYTLTDIAIVLFAFAIFIFNRIHLLNSPIYLHEANTFMTLNVIKEIFTLFSTRHLIIIDEPAFPYYEILNFIFFNFPGSYHITLLSSDPEIRFYEFTYINGNPKPRPQLAPIDLAYLRPDSVIITSQQFKLNKNELNRVYISGMLCIYYHE